MIGAYSLVNATNKTDKTSKISCWAAIAGGLFFICLIVIGLVVCFISIVRTSTSAFRPDDTVFGSNSNASSTLLFIGNSFTYYNDGVGPTVYNIARSESPSPMIVCDQAAIGGATLEELWSINWIQGRITDVHNNQNVNLPYKYVVVQDTISEYDSRNIDDVSTKF